MMNHKIFESLQNAKVAKDKRWLITYTKYIMKKAEDPSFTYHQLQNRMNVVHGQSKNYFSDYYNNMNKTKKREVVTAQLKRQTSKKILDKQRKTAAKQRKIAKLYETGQLSKKSTDKIFRTIGE